MSDDLSLKVSAKAHYLKLPYRLGVILVRTMCGQGGRGALVMICETDGCTRIPAPEFGGTMIYRISKRRKP